ncbi:Sip5p [Sugiyamaella lignohabitans]|uniref:Sip5p n=1 Tax=Sugiyamaella lignohabitans TaxID=796027 RepID=A0A167EU47_9ASCO|nr:Sip5p [Sugiyamaella lignohabitans]ANB14458.1 Sip5p [Sugiyamaella lignohabitans]
MGNVPTKDVSATGSGSNSRSRSASTATAESSTTTASSSRRTRLSSTSSRSTVRDETSGFGTSVTGLSRKSGKKKEKSSASDAPLVSDVSEMVDGGYLVPQGVYSGPQDFKAKVVRNLIIERRLAPFYKGIEDYDDTWTDRQLLAAVRNLPIPPATDPVVSPTTSSDQAEPVEEPDRKKKEKEADTPVDPATETDESAEQGYESENALKWVSSSLPNAVGGSFLQARNSDDGGSSGRLAGFESNPSIRSSSSRSSDPDDGILSPPSNGKQKQPMTPPLAASAEEDETIPFPSSPASSSSGAMRIIEFKTETMHIEDTATGTNSISTNASARITSGGGISIETRPREGSAKLGPPILLPRNRANTTSRYGPGPTSSSMKPAPPPMEVILYRGAIECPICFLNYPKYLNTTRCCTQPICSECFVQIKRPDPHPPYHENNGSGPSTAPATDNPEEALVSEPACCPFCQMPEFGVVYIPSPHRSGIPASSLTSSLRAHLSSSLSGVFSSHHHTPVSSSAASIVSMSTSNSATGTPRRRGSLPPNAPEVVTTDHVRPDWAMKLSRARHQLARKSAAANALHASAFLFEGNEGAASSSSSHSRRHDKKKKSSSRLRGLSSPSSPASILGSSSSGSGSSRRHTTSSPSSGTSFPVPSRTRIRDLEDMMIVEAIRRSLTDERSGSPSGESPKAPASQSSQEVKKDEITTQ